MSALTDALSFSLLCDLEGHLDAYQLSRVGTGDQLWPDASVQQAASWYLAHSLFKKYNDKDRPSVEACSVALSKFLECNEANRTFDVKPEFTHQEEIINDISDEIYSFWYVGDGRCTPLVSTFNTLYERGRLGNGSNRCARDNDFYTKVFDSPLSSTSDDLSFIWEKLSASDPRRFHAEQMRSRLYGFRKLEGNSLSFVNKNVTTARGIATEPTINMWFQLGMAAVLTDRLKSRYDISLDVQPEINRAMARMGSMAGRFATIDMESASDLISLRLCERIFPKGMLTWLKLIRSPATRLPSGERVELHSISTMGNGFTFPLMTMLFCAVISVVYKRLGIPVKFGNSEERSFSVFGDDLIVVPEAVPLLYKTLALLGFRVNHTKSYVEGPFRESCGADFFLGAPVRGVYIKRLRSVQDHVVAINGLNRWSAYTGIQLPTLLGHLLRLHKKLAAVLYGPPDEADDSCVHVPLDMARGVKRMNHGIIRYRRWLPKQRFLEINSEDGTVTSIGGGVKRSYNPMGLQLAFLYGAIRSGRITVQADSVTYSMKPRVSAQWDILAPERRSFGFDWRRWSSAVRDNLTSHGCVG